MSSSSLLIQLVLRNWSGGNVDAELVCPSKMSVSSSMRLGAIVMAWTPSGGKARLACIIPLARVVIPDKLTFMFSIMTL